MAERKLKHTEDAPEPSDLESMVRNLAHEVNSPLSAITLRAEGILDSLDGGELDSDYIKTSAEAIVQSVERVVRIIKAVHSYSRMSFKTPFVSSSVSELIEAALREVRPRLDEAKIQVRVVPFDSDMKIKCRPTEIHQILTNLLRNSVEAISSLAGPWIELEVCKIADGTEMRLTDSGPGIPKDRQLQIFQPLFSTKSRKTNMGVGLALCAKMAEVHGGKLWLDTKKNNTCFVLSLPDEPQGVFKVSGEGECE